jgi:hypothetical protein
MATFHSIGKCIYTHFYYFEISHPIHHERKDEKERKAEGKLSVPQKSLGLDAYTANFIKRFFLEADSMDQVVMYALQRLYCWNV